MLEPRLLRMDVPTEQVEDKEESARPRRWGAASPSTPPSGRHCGGPCWPASSRLRSWSPPSRAVPGSPWRNEDGGFLPESPLLDSIVFIVFVMFAVPGIVYGFRAGTFTQASDVPG